MTLLGPLLPLKQPVTNQTKVLAVLWLFGNRESFRSVADRFNTAKVSWEHFIVTVNMITLYKFQKSV